MIKYTGSNALSMLVELLKDKLDSIYVVRDSVTVNSSTSTISIPFTITNVTKLDVYHNGILLELGTNYTISNLTQVNLSDYTTENGDVISFVYHTI